MSVPSLPTDNLYKFMALAGLLLVVLSIYYPTQRIGELQLKQVSVDVEINLAELEANEIAADVSRLEKQKDVTHENVRAAESRNRQAKRNLIRLRGLASTQTVLVSQLRNMLVIGGFGLLLGTILSWVGFRLWYVRVQRPADDLALSSSAAT